MIIRYKLVDGEVKREILAAGRHTRGEERPLPFHQTLLNAHYVVECEQGSRYRSGYPKSVTKRVLEGALAREKAIVEDAMNTGHTIFRRMLHLQGGHGEIPPWDEPPSLPPPPPDPNVFINQYPSGFTNNTGSSPQGSGMQVINGLGYDPSKPTYGFGSGEPTRRGIDIGVSGAANVFLPGFGWIAGKIARGVWHMIQNMQMRNASKQEIQQAVEQRVQQQQEPGSGGGGYYSPAYLRSIGYGPGQGKGSLWPGSTGNRGYRQDDITSSSYDPNGPFAGSMAVGGIAGGGGSFFHQMPGVRGGPLPGSGGLYGGGSYANVSALGGWQNRGTRMAQRIRDSIAAGTYTPPPPSAPYKYPSPILQQAGIDMARNMGMVQTSGHFGGPVTFAYPGSTPVNWSTVGQTTTTPTFGTPDLGGGPSTIGSSPSDRGGRIQSFHQGGNVNPGLKLFHKQQLKRKKP